MHGASYCFACPLYMGESSGTCTECLPDMQRQTNGQTCTEFCVLGERQMGDFPVV